MPYDTVIQAKKRKGYNTKYNQIHMAKKAGTPCQAKPCSSHPHHTHAQHYGVGNGTGNLPGNFEGKYSEGTITRVIRDEIRDPPWGGGPWPWGLGRGPFSRFGDPGRDSEKCVLYVRGPGSVGKRTGTTLVCVPPVEECPSQTTSVNHPF